MDFVGRPAKINNEQRAETPTKKGKKRIIKKK